MLMNNQNLLRGIFLIGVSLLFGLGSFKYNLGQFSHAGPGLFPLVVSCMLFLIGVLTVVRSRLVAPVAMDYNQKNIAIILLSLCGFALISHFITAILGIVFLVFVSTLAGSTYSVSRNLKTSAGLIAIAFLFQKLLGLNLPLY